MRYILPVLLLLSVAGCGSSGNAGLYGRPQSTRDADRQYKARLLNLVDRQTNRADVISIMGDPDQEDEAYRAIMYYWTVREKDSDDIVRSFVLCQFDKKDVLIRHAQYDHAAKFGGPKLPEDAMNEFLGIPPR